MTGAMSYTATRRAPIQPRQQQACIQIQRLVRGWLTRRELIHDVRAEFDAICKDVERRGLAMKVRSATAVDSLSSSDERRMANALTGLKRQRIEYHSPQIICRPQFIPIKSKQKSPTLQPTTTSPQSIIMTTTITINAANSSSPIGAAIPSPTKPATITPESVAPGAHRSPFMKEEDDLEESKYGDFIRSPTQVKSATSLSTPSPAALGSPHLTTQPVHFTPAPTARSEPLTNVSTPATPHAESPMPSVAAISSNEHQPGSQLDLQNLSVDSSSSLSFQSLPESSPLIVELPSTSFPPNSSNSSNSSSQHVPSPLTSDLIRPLATQIESVQAAIQQRLMVHSHN